jgi:tryptophan synthase alpha chain
MNEQLNTTLAATRGEGRAALVGYLPAGFPSIPGGARAVQALIDGGCDVVEIGLPHSDPVLDGPTIQTADDIALRAGIRTRDVLATVREVTTANPAVP